MSNVIEILNLFPMGGLIPKGENYQNPEQAKGRFPESPPFLPRNLEMLQQLFMIPAQIPN